MKYLNKSRRKRIQVGIRKWLYYINTVECTWRTEGMKSAVDLLINIALRVFCGIPGNEDSREYFLYHVKNVVIYPERVHR